MLTTNTHTKKEDCEKEEDKQEDVFSEQEERNSVPSTVSVVPHETW